MDDFTDISAIDNILLEYLNKSGYAFKNQNPDEDNFQLYYSLKFDDHDIGIFISIATLTPFRIDVVSAVNFSPEHITILKENPENVKEVLKQSVFMWLAPREPQFILNLNEENEFEGSNYIIITPFYEGELSFPTLMRSIDKTISASLLTRKIIQDTLNRHMVKSSE